MLATRYNADDRLEAGIDEAGRGCFFGAMYAAAVIWPAEEAWTDRHREIAPQIRDSKKISPKKRERICDAIKELAVAYGIGSVSAAEIDDHGMTWANQTAFVRAVESLSIAPQRLIIDGILSLPNGAVGPQIEVYTVIEGDAQYMAIAAASILAKVEHDRALMTLCDEDPTLDEKYGLRSCKGYGTAKHRAGIETHGLHAFHRRRFIKPRGCLIQLSKDT